VGHSATECPTLFSFVALRPFCLRRGENFLLFSKAHIPLDAFA